MELGRCVSGLLLWCMVEIGAGQVIAQESGTAIKVATSPTTQSLDELRALGAQRSKYRAQSATHAHDSIPQPQLDAYRTTVEPILKQACVDCHGPDTQEGNVRIDTLDPNLLHGDDVSWWLEILAVVSKSEMPPPDQADLSDDDRATIVEWVSQEVHTASVVRRGEQHHSSFRRMTRYEYNYALQDLLGLPYDFAKDLPPEANSDDGFQNSSELLHMSAVQFATYQQLGRRALQRATVRGTRPKPLYWSVSMQAASASGWAGQEAELDQLRLTHKDAPEETLQQELQRQIAVFQTRHGQAHYKNNANGRTIVAQWSYPEAKYAWKPDAAAPQDPPPSEFVAVIPPRQRLIVELGDQLPEEGLLRVRFRASRIAGEDAPIPSLQLEFGWQASNDSHASVRISDHDIAIDAPSHSPRFYQWELPLSEIYPRNLVRNTSKLGDLPSPSEFVRFVNSSVSQTDVQIDYVEISAPVYDAWPPASHSQIFFVKAPGDSEAEQQVAARTILTRFMQRAWRRPVTDNELEQKLSLFAKLRPQCNDFQQAMIEVMASVLTSPKFFYLVRADDVSAPLTEEKLPALQASELATRLSMFLWCSIPDQELLDLASEDRLCDASVLDRQVQRMLADPRSRRFSEQFVRQWLGLQLLDYLKVDANEYPLFDDALKEAMRIEPVAMFHEMLQNNASVLDFLHADYTMANERLAQHYGLTGVAGNNFRRVPLNQQPVRGGLLTEAGILAMNSDGKDSHPIKRGIWLLDRVLNDPPPPPPPAVPKIDLTDPEIAKLTLKERILNHRDQAACRSCHMKIDPWGLAFENFDAVGAWRNDVRGQPVDATSTLLNHQEIAGIEGLKRYLLNERQDQFVRALAHKMSTFALGRPLTFADRAAVDQITTALRQEDDGLATLVTRIAQSDLFQGD